MPATMEKKQNHNAAESVGVKLPREAVNLLIESNLLRLQESFFLKTANSVPENEEALRQKAVQLQIPVDGVFYTVCVFEIQTGFNDFSFDILTLLLRDSLRARMLASGFGIHFFINQSARLCAVIRVKKPEDSATIESGVAGVIQQLKTVADTRILYGVGTSVESLVRLSESADDALAALESTRYLNDSAYSMLLEIDEKYRSRETIQPYLMECFRNSDLEEIEKAIKNHTAFLLMSSREKQPLAERFVFAYLQNITNECLRLGVTLERFENYVPAVVSLMQSDVDGAIEPLLKLTEQIIKYIKVHRTSESNHLLSMAKEFIRAHMSDETLNLETVSDHVGLSRVYFCKLFHQMEGVSFSTYLRHVRIERAKQLLLNTNMKVFEISNAVGFSHAKYFSQVFRQEVGITPVEFQKGTYE